MHDKSLFKALLLCFFQMQHLCLIIVLILLSLICRGLDALSGKNKSANPPSLPMDTVVLSLQDLIFYFRPPEEELEHEDKQFKLRSLKNRQNLFQEEVGSLTEK